MTDDNEPEVSMFEQAYDEGEWENVAQESGIRVILENEGDKFVGQYVGDEKIEPEDGGESFELYNFIGPDGERYSVNKSYKLVRAMDKVKIGQWCRILLVRLIKVAGQPSPLKDFRVDVRK